MKSEKPYQKYLALIKDHPLFRGLREEEIPGLLDYLSAAVETIEAGTPINTVGSRGDDSVRSCCILAGCAQHIKYDVRGKCSILEYIVSGSLLGCSQAFAGMPCQISSIVAAEKCICLYLDLKKLDRGNGESWDSLSRLSLNLIRILAEQNQRMLQKMDIVAHRTLREKILTYLSQERDKQQSDTIYIPFSRQEMADFLYVERSSLSTELGKLRQEGLLKFHHNHFQFTINK
ncbi:Crp/Fnr family transcriptional regulator [Desulfosporosinus youngiae]|uniref:cAMP-binding protein n=1 Tax=Desulfosporosinus youngiae DSM 17734 TaxID=768710 RepID=H5XWL4_9FIRM|nr:Crp/Fnr family transcriptional regulator [Desulfosporosinus youngiae]EHQ90522.1 cAMP-binding protein [Desulfosporosinus youngiae DSM 17734]